MLPTWRDEYKTDAHIYMFHSIHSKTVLRKKPIRQPYKTQKIVFSFRALYLLYIPKKETKCSSCRTTSKQPLIVTLRRRIVLIIEPEQNCVEIM